MQIPFLTLVGFTLTTICTSICPMNMGMMSMNHGDMEMTAPMKQHKMALEMKQDKQKEVPCQRCEQDEEEVLALSSHTKTISIGSLIPFMSFGTQSTYTGNIYTKQAISPLANGPPIQAETLIGTVILRT